MRITQQDLRQKRRPPPLTAALVYFHVQIQPLSSVRPTPKKKRDQLTKNVHDHWRQLQSLICLYLQIDIVNHQICGLKIAAPLHQKVCQDSLE